MKHITMGEINKFQCIGSKCPFTCCASWGSITVDTRTDEYYQSVGGEFGLELNRNIDRSHTPFVMKTYGAERRCAFLNEDNLCRIYIELGPEHMCETCRRYPRIDRMAGDIHFHHMTISCPEVGRIFFNRKKPIEFHMAEDDVTLAAPYLESIDWSFFRFAERAFSLNAAILQNRSYTIAERERILLLFNRALQNALDAGKKDEAETLLTFFSEQANYDSFSGSKISGELSSKVRFFRELCELFVGHESNAVVTQMFMNCLIYIQSKDADLEMMSHYLAQVDGEAFEKEQENLLIYLLFNHYLSSGFSQKDASKDLFRQIVFILTLFQFYRIFSAIFSINQGAVISEDKRILIFSHLSRYFEHSSPKFRELCTDILEKRQFYDLSFLFRLIS